MPAWRRPGCVVAREVGRGWAAAHCLFPAAAYNKLLAGTGAQRQTVPAK